MPHDHSHAGPAAGIDVLDLMQHHGVRPSSNRILVASALAKAPRPVSMAELEADLDTVDKSGISRALALFREHQMVHVIEDGSEAVRYELCTSHHSDSDDDLHVHFYCRACRRTFCLRDVPVPGVPLPEGYRMEGVNYMVKGLCPECSGRP